MYEQIFFWFILAKDESNFKCAVTNYFLENIEETSKVLNLNHFKSSSKGKFKDIDYDLDIMYTNNQNMLGNRKWNFPEEEKTCKLKLCVFLKKVNHKSNNKQMNSSLCTGSRTEAVFRHIKQFV